MSISFIETTARFSETLPEIVIKEANRLLALDMNEAARDGFIPYRITMSVTSKGTIKIKMNNISRDAPASVFEKLVESFDSRSL